MKNIFVNISINLQNLLKLNHQDSSNINKQEVECNYSNNYYGDQQCQPIEA
jgi:hypothetical protein